jgi:hypothetical protein
MIDSNAHVCLDCFEDGDIRACIEENADSDHAPCDFCTSHAISTFLHKSCRRPFIAQAIGLHAYASGKPVLYMSIIALQENLAIARSSSTYLRYRAKLAQVRSDYL